MYYFIAEILVALIFISGYRLLTMMTRSENQKIADWADVLWVPLVALLSITWVNLSLSILPWESNFTPISMLIHQVGAKQAASKVAQDMANVHYFGSMLVAFLYAANLGWLLLTVVKKFERDFYDKSSLYSSDFHSTVDALFLFVRAVIYLVLAFVLMRTLNLDHLANSLFTTGAVVTAFVTFAARESIANIFGGITILLDRPFRVGDYISSPDRDIEGTVERIGWRMTQVRSPSKQTKYIPNCIFTTVSIENLTRMSNRRIRFQVSLRYDDLDKVEKICQKIEKSLEGLEFIDKRMSNFCTFNSLGDFSVNLLFNAFTKPQSFREYNKSIEKALHLVVRVVKRHRADFPFPTTTLDADDIVSKLKDTIKEE